MSRRGWLPKRPCLAAAGRPAPKRWVPASSPFAAHCAGGRGAEDWTVTLPTRWLTALGCYKSVRARGLAGPLEEAVEALHSGTGLGQSLRPKPRGLRPPPSAGWRSCPAEAVRGRFPGGRFPARVRRSGHVPWALGPSCCAGTGGCRPVRAWCPAASRLPGRSRSSGGCPYPAASFGPKPSGALGLAGSRVVPAEASRFARPGVPSCLRGSDRSRRRSGRSGPSPPSWLRPKPPPVWQVGFPLRRSGRGRSRCRSGRSGQAWDSGSGSRVRPFPQDCARGRGSRAGAG